MERPEPGDLAEIEIERNGELWIVRAWYHAAYQAGFARIQITRDSAAASDEYHASLRCDRIATMQFMREAQARAYVAYLQRTAGWPV